ncbi:MAG: type secretion protein IcmF [Pedosphaera sp.]|nr:type secretion protein IcmF [Pedosphaera sp.]
MIKQLLDAIAPIWRLPRTAKVILAIIAALGLGALASKGLGKGGWVFVVILVVLLLVLLGGYLLWRSWQRRKQNAQLGGELQQHSSGSPRGISDPGQRARLDDLRKKFESGIEAYRSRGKDLYKLPWYVIVGEPGSGKTEAIRHSNVGFPPGMQDEFQGVGGTINMNWWFTNNAVLLDTAGRLMFEEVKPGETSEWKEFLQLLKKNRPNCPVNGLFLVIPSDSLIKNSAEEIAMKAGKIAQQLDTIQRVLDVRFPVFVIITKCDKINGFREFFDGLTDPQLQHQMMGWSNPEPLDNPFRPELVSQHLDQVVQRLRRRRLGLMRDPVPENPIGRRTDEVDSLYALPHSLSLLSSRLRRYLETIFVAGEWSAKPLFLRGIYFSSSMREGSALDQDLAEAIGVPVDDLPEGKVWERERAYFLRDLFIEKVFRERGLVTSASNTKKMLRSRKIALFSFGFGALALFIGLAWLGMSSLRSGIRDQSDYWTAVGDAGWQNKDWKQSIIPMRDNGTFAEYVTNQVYVAGTRPPLIPIGDFHVKLHELADKPLKRNWLFPGLADKYNRNSKTAQRIVFEAGVVKPLIDASRQKMKMSDGAPQKGQAEALIALIRLESDILSRNKGTNNGTISEDGAKNFMSPLLSYISGQDSTPDPKLVTTMVWTYSTNESAKGTWPSMALSGSSSSTNNLANNTELRAGLEAFLRSVTNNIQTQIGSWNQTAELRNALKKFQSNEADLFSAVQAADQSRISRAFDELAKIKATVDEQLKKTTSSSLFQGGVSLTSAYQNLTKSVLVSGAGALDKVRQADEASLRDNSGHPLFVAIQARLIEAQNDLTNRIEQLSAAGDLAEIKNLDELHLAKMDDLLAYAKRFNLYQDAVKAIDAKWINRDRLVGFKGDALDEFLAKQITPLKKGAAGYSGKLQPQVATICNYLADRADGAQRNAFLTAYLEEAKKTMSGSEAFPLVANLSAKPLSGVPELKKASASLKLISEDVLSPTLKGLSSKERAAEWESFTNHVVHLAAVAKAILGGTEDGPMMCTISLRKLEDTPNPKDDWRNKGIWRNLKMTSEGESSKLKETALLEDEILGQISIQQPFEVLLFKVDEATDKESYKSDPWGPLWLICKYKGLPAQKNDLTTWVVDWPVERQLSAGAIRLKFKFDRPMPGWETWPVQ